MPGRAILRSLAELSQIRALGNGLDHLPASGAAIPVADRPTGLADRILVAAALRRRRDDLRFLASPTRSAPPRVWPSSACRSNGSGRSVAGPRPASSRSRSPFCWATAAHSSSSPGAARLSVLARPRRAAPAGEIGRSRPAVRRAVLPPRILADPPALSRPRSQLDEEQRDIPRSTSSSRITGELARRSAPRPSIEPNSKAGRSRWWPAWQRVLERGRRERRPFPPPAGRTVPETPRRPGSQRSQRHAIRIATLPASFEGRGTNAPTAPRCTQGKRRGSGTGNVPRQGGSCIARCERGGGERARVDRSSG
jgi:hypothetical protein